MREKKNYFYFEKQETITPLGLTALKQQNSKCGLCCDRDKKVNHIISELNELLQKKYKIQLSGEGYPLEIVQKN